MVGVASRKKVGKDEAGVWEASLAREGGRLKTVAVRVGHWIRGSSKGAAALQTAP